jgi:anti-sigma factor RsiW
MNCEEAKKLMDGYLDGELDPITNQKIEEHLRDCPECDQADKTHRAFIGAVGNGAPYDKAPSKLRERIQSSLRAELAKEPARNVVGDAPSFVPRQRQRRSPLLPEQSGVCWRWPRNHSRRDHCFEFYAQSRRQAMISFSRRSSSPVTRGPFCKSSDRHPVV